MVYNFKTIPRFPIGLRAKRSWYNQEKVANGTAHSKTFAFGIAYPVNILGFDV